MMRIETTTDECPSCRICHGCLAGIHSACYPVQCIDGPRRHDCACQNAACVARRAA